MDCASIRWRDYGRYAGCLICVGDIKTNVSQTSIDNYHNHVKPHLIQPVIRQILGVMESNKSFTIGELAALTGLDKSCVSARRFEMIANGFVERGIDRKCSQSGKLCQTVFLCKH